MSKKYIQKINLIYGVGIQKYVLQNASPFYTLFGG